MTEAPATSASSAKPAVWKWVLNRLLGRSSKPATIPRDSIREGLETIVFVVVLVFLLKQFVVEAFVIPTGSMAETLYGYRMAIQCPECGYDFELNASCEVDPSDGILRRVQGYCCPNCRNKRLLPPDRPLGADATSGDRVLVLKAIYHREKAQPGDVVVFKFPEKPQKDYGAQNYIKRMWATGGQTLAIWRGDLYVCDNLEYPASALDGRGERCERPDDPNELWRYRYTYANAEIARSRFEQSLRDGFPDDGTGFRLIRKNEVLLDELKRIVYDNDHQAEFLKSKGVEPRWKAQTADWKADPSGKTFTHQGTGLGWLRYRHLIVEDWRAIGSGRAQVAPSLIDNFLGYNAEVALNNAGNFDYVLDRGTEDYKYWVGDLILECQAQFEDAAAEVVLELSKGPNRFQAIFKGGTVTLRRTGPEGKDLASAQTPINGPGQFALKFANVDCRLRVWVNGKAIDFGKPVDYTPKRPEKFEAADYKEEGWVTANDIDAPVSIGASGAVAISQLKIWRDTYYIPINEQYRHAAHISDSVTTLYAQPGHYICLGDNSAQSSDSRVWGSVPDRLLLGKAVCIFWPSWPVSKNRIGLIK